MHTSYHRITLWCCVIIALSIIVTPSLLSQERPYERGDQDRERLIDPSATDSPSSPAINVDDVSNKSWQKQPPKPMLVTIPAASIIPTLDGVVNASEYTDAVAVNGLTVTTFGNVAYMKNDACFLYIGAKIFGYSAYAPHNATMINVWFDLNKNGQWDLAGNIDGNLALPAPAGLPTPLLPANSGALGYPFLTTPLEYASSAPLGCTWGTSVTGRLRYHRPWYCAGIGQPLSAVFAKLTVVNAGTGECHMEAKVDLTNSPLKMIAGVPVNMRIQWYDGYYVSGNGVVTILAQWPTVNGSAYFNGPTPTEMSDLQTTFVPMVGDLLDIASVDLSNATNYAWNIGQTLPVTVVGTTIAAPQTTTFTATLTGPAPSGTTWTWTTPITLTTSPQTITVNVPTSGLTRGFYEIEVAVDDPGPCGVMKKKAKYRILILGVGEGPCVVYSGDLNNDGSCNLSDRNALNKYIYDANTRASWLQGPVRLLVGPITANSTPMDIFTWVPEAGLPWQTALGCYMDADGNGVINTLDLWGVKINLSKTHAIPKESPAVPTPQDFIVYQNYPNPFNPSTNITFEIPEESAVQIKVTDQMGRHIGQILDEIIPAGSHNITFDASDLPSGIYYYTFIGRGLTTSRIETKTFKMTLTK